MDCREPQGLAHRLERAEIAPRANDAVVKGNLINDIHKHRLDFGNLPLAIQFFDFAPNELHANRALQHGLKGEGKGIKMAWLNESTQHPRSVLEILLGINHRDMKLFFQVSSTEISRELTADDEALGFAHGTESSLW